MSFKSQAQIKYFFSHPKLRDIAKRWSLDLKKDVKDLPVHVARKKKK